MSQVTLCNAEGGTGINGNRKANYLGVALLENESLKAAIHEVLNLSCAIKESAGTHDAEGSWRRSTSGRFLAIIRIKSNKGINPCPAAC
jgi:hypothetical protein